MGSSDFPPAHPRAVPGNLSHDATWKYMHINRWRRLLDLPSLIESAERSVVVPVAINTPAICTSM